MAEFASLHSYWKLDQSVQANAKCVGERAELLHGEHDTETEAFLRTVLETSAAREKILPGGLRLYRAQLAYELRTEHSGFGEEDDEAEMIDYEIACSAERMLPDATKVGDGRANRKGNPYLYLAEKPETALAEMRSWVSSLATLAQFILIRDSRVIDCSRNTKESLFYERVDVENGGARVEPDAPTREEGVWGDISSAFAKPVSSDRLIEYVPTQVLASAFHQHGYDGIAYKSLLDGGGENVVLFDATIAKQHPYRCLYKTKAVSYEFVQYQYDLFAPVDPCSAWPPRPHITSRYCQESF